MQASLGFPPFYPLLGILPVAVYFDVLTAQKKKGLAGVDSFFLKNTKGVLICEEVLILLQK
jgi:hypothetical protein